MIQAAPTLPNRRRALLQLGHGCPERGLLEVQEPQPLGRQALKSAARHVAGHLLGAPPAQIPQHLAEGVQARRLVGLALSLHGFEGSSGRDGEEGKVLRLPVQSPRHALAAVVHRLAPGLLGMEVHLVEHEEEVGRELGRASDELQLELPDRGIRGQDDEPGIDPRKEPERTLRGFLLRRPDSRGVDEHEPVGQVPGRAGDLDPLDPLLVAGVLPLGHVRFQRSRADRRLAPIDVPDRDRGGWPGPQERRHGGEGNDARREDRPRGVIRKSSDAF